ncbi:MAG: transcription factor [Spirochaetaceae bacterium]|jgi:transglutaminase-like putative cysteine protease|nr:transcription factor [Spirochaetaceae bacterium]
MLNVYRSAKIVLLLLLAACGAETPKILATDPKLAVTGQTLTILGEFFGDEQGESFVTIGGVSPTLSSYIEWTDNKIVLRLPDFGESGLVYVQRKDKKSNPVLLPSLRSIPEFPKSSVSYAPVITQIRPDSAAIGDLIVIQGSGFGGARDSGAVFFSWAAENPASLPANVSPPPLIKARDGGAYESWTEHEIRVRVSDGAASGVVQAFTSRGASNTVPFRVSGKPGSKTIRDKRTYSISYSVDVRVKDAKPPNNMYLWCPVPASTASQLNKETLFGNTPPFIEDYLGVSLYRFTGLRSGDERRVSVSYLVDVYSVETRIQPELVKPYGDSPVRAWTLPSAFVPSNDAAIREAAENICGRINNPYLKANTIYRWFVDEFQMAAGSTLVSLQQALLEKKAGPYEAAMLYTALCRAAGIPAIPVAGVLCPKTGGAIPHYWAEFWIDSFGWMPVDPFLGAGAVPGNSDDTTEFPPDFSPAADKPFKLRDDHEAYYFGNMDNQHLAFSYGETSLSQIDTRGRTARSEASYALQNIWEEAGSGIEAYSSHWSDINITGIYLN